MPSVTRLVLALPAALAFTLPAAAEEVVVFAAASMKTALDQVAAVFQQQTGHVVTISHAGSGALARQIIEGAPADIFISASVEWMDEVEKAGAVQPGMRGDLLGNRLVLVAHDADMPPVDLTADTDLAGMLDGGRLAMAMVDSVPAGQYGKAALTSLGLWEGVADAIAQTDNVRAALALVARGEAPLGIVYATDAAADPSVHVVATFAQGTHDPIRYPAALLNHGTDAADRAFYQALSAPEADAIFARLGFAVLN